MSPLPAPNAPALTANASLSAMNSFGVPARARWLARLRDPGHLPALLKRHRGMPVLTLGEGSNVLLRGDVEGLVLRIEASRVALLGENAAGGLVRAEAGANWHRFVEWSLDHGFEGLENLALIPGTVGAAPIQNIGAYGVELDRHIESVEAFDRVAGRTVVFARSECGFAYRESRFKDPAELDRYVIVAVRFRLPRRAERVLHYPGVTEELAVQESLGRPTARAVFEAVCAIRRRKLPDPARLGNAGSFFKNPIVPVAQAEALAAQHPGLPAYPGSDAGTRKLSAAWLIERAGWRGHRDGPVGVSEQHALVLVHHGGGDGAAIWALAQRIQADIAARFGVSLEPEPRLI